jgi:hypothetical protein
MFTNPKPNLHIDLLKSQYAVFSTVLKRMMKEHNDKQYQLGKELFDLKIQIQYDNRNKKQV